MGSELNQVLVYWPEDKTTSIFSQGEICRLHREAQKLPAEAEVIIDTDAVVYARFQNKKKASKGYIKCISSKFRLSWSSNLVCLHAFFFSNLTLCFLMFQKVRSFYRS